MIFELERTNPGTRTLIAKGRVVTLTHGEPLKVFLNAEQCAAFSNTAGVTVTPVEEPKPATKATTAVAVNPKKVAYAGRDAAKKRGE